MNVVSNGVNIRHIHNFKGDHFPNKVTFMDVENVNKCIHQSSVGINKTHRESLEVERERELTSAC